MNELVGILAPFLLAGIVGFIAWVWLLWRDHHALKLEFAALRLHVAENYSRNVSMNELAGEVRHLHRVVIEIAGKLGVQVQERHA